MKTVAIIILNWNKSQLTIETVNSVLKIVHRDFKYKIFILDNGSTDNSFELLTRKYCDRSSVTLLKTNQNLGFGSGNNYAVTQAKSINPDYYLLLNNDVIVDPNFLEQLINYSTSHQKYQLISPKIYFAPGFEFHKDRYQKKDLGKVIWFAGGKMDWKNINGYHRGVDQIDHGQFAKVFTHNDFLSGCCLLINATVIDHLGLFDDKYYMYLEDADFCQKAIKNGYRLAVVPNSVVWHLNAGSSGVGGLLQDYFLSRNRLLFGYRYASFRTKFALARQSFVKLISSPYLWQKKGIRDYYLGKFGKGSWL